MLTEEQVYLKIFKKDINGKTYNIYIYNFDEEETLEKDDLELFEITCLSLDGKGERFDLSALKTFSNIRGLRLNMHQYTSIDTLLMYTELEYFQVLDLCDAQLPFDRFKKLHSAEVNYDHKTCHLLFDNQSIEYLILHNCKQKSATDLAKLKTLKQLSLEQCKFENLDFLEELTQLRSFRISYNRVLTSIRGLRKVNSLNMLEIAYCKKIKDWSSLSQAVQLNAIILEDCGEIESLTFLESLPNLKVLSVIGNTVISDGLLKSLISKENLEYVSIVLHKHYDISNGDLLRFNFVSMSEIMKGIEQCTLNCDIN